MGANPKLRIGDRRHTRLCLLSPLIVCSNFQIGEILPRRTKTINSRALGSISIIIIQATTRRAASVREMGRLRETVWMCATGPSERRSPTTTIAYLCVISFIKSIRRRRLEPLLRLDRRFCCATAAAYWIVVWVRLFCFC